MNRLGENLSRLRKQFQHSRFSAPTSLRLSLEMLEALEQLHSLGFVHRDVKPSNFCINEESGITKIYLIDFGLCRQHHHFENGEIKTQRQRKVRQFRGTPHYAAISAHKGGDQFPKEDIESWLYVVIEFMTGELPWSHCDNSDHDAILKAKEESRTMEGSVQLLKHCPRTEFRRIMKYVDGLHFDSAFDYQFIRQMVLLSMKNNDIEPNEPYDWQLPDEI